MKNSRLKADIKNILIISFFTALASQINIHLYNDSFIASLGVICIPLFIYLFDEVKPIPTSIVTSAAIFAMRLLFHAIQFRNLSGVINLYLPESVFYIACGIMLYIFEELTCHSRKLYIFIPGIILIDFIGNNLELFARTQAGSEMAKYQQLLIIVACIRGIILLTLLVMLDRYRILLLSKTHAKRYQRLIMLISKLNGEVIWMEKNFDQIEKTMSTSYSLYNHLMDEGNEKAASDALSIAKDIHEIKKEYHLICQGLKENIGTETDNGLEMSELFTILIQSVQSGIAQTGKRLFVVIDCKDKLFTRDPYLFLSVFHNLITNALDASRIDACTVTIREQADGDNYKFMVSDNGPGIPQKYADRIFEPRFSTKINYETGAVNRGLGLPVVKDIIEGNLGGKITLSNTGHGAKFIITIPKTRLEVIE